MSKETHQILIGYYHYNFMLNDACAVPYTVKPQFISCSSNIILFHMQNKIHCPGVFVFNGHHVHVMVFLLGYPNCNSSCTSFLALEQLIQQCNLILLHMILAFVCALSSSQVYDHTLYGVS